MHDTTDPYAARTALRLLRSETDWIIGRHGARIQSVVETRLLTD